MFRFFVFFVFFVLVSAGFSSFMLAQQKSWSDSSGKFKIEATAIRFDGEQVFLWRSPKKITKVPLAKLSPEDQAYLVNNRVLNSLYLLEKIQYDDALKLVKKSESSQERAIYAWIISADRRASLVEEFDPPKAKKICDEIMPELIESSNPLDKYLVARLMFNLREFDKRYDDKCVELTLKSCDANVPNSFGFKAILVSQKIGGLTGSPDLQFKLWGEELEKYNSPIAIYNRGAHYFNGVGVERSEGKAIDYLEKAASAEMELAYTVLCSYYFSKIDEVELPAPDALRSLLRYSGSDKAKRKNMKEARRNLNKRNRLLNVAEKWAKKGADEGLASGFVDLANCKLKQTNYLFDDATSSSLSNEVTELYRKAANLFHPQALVFMVAMLEKLPSIGEFKEVEKYSEMLESLSSQDLSDGDIQLVQKAREKARRLIDDATKHIEQLQKATLIIESWSWQRSGSGAFVEVNGEVANNTSKKLDGVVAVATFKTADDELVTTAQSIVEFNPLLPGQKSPFKCITAFNPRMKTCSLKFKFLMGRQIKAASRKKKSQ